MRCSSAITSLGSLLVAVCLCTPIAVAAPWDIAGHPAEAAITALYDRGIIKGYPDGTFRPDNAITRAEVASLLLRAIGDTVSTQDVWCFRDLEVRTPQWYAAPLCRARAWGFIHGYPDGTVRPLQPVTLAEALSMTLRAFHVPLVDAPDQPWDVPLLRTARAHGWLLPILRDPMLPLRRGDLATLVHTILAWREDAPLPPHEGICGNGIVEAGEQCDDGNVLDSDGCSSVCIIVPEPIRLAVLRVTEEAGGTLQPVTPGSTVTLLQLRMDASRQDVLLLGLTLRATAGSLQYGARYALEADIDQDGRYETTLMSNGRVAGSILSFDALPSGTIVTTRRPLSLRVRAELWPGGAPVTLGLGLATDLGRYVQAQGAVDGIALQGIETDGLCEESTCFISVYTRERVPIDVVGKGSLAVTLDSTPVRSHILLAGTEGTPLLRLRLHATGEPIEVQRLRLEGATDSIAAVVLERGVPGAEQGSLVGKATAGQCEHPMPGRLCVHFPLQSLVVSPTSDVVLMLRASVAPDVLGGQSGDSVTLRLEGAASATSAAIEAIGTTTRQALAQNDGDYRDTGEIFIGTTGPGPSTSIVGPTHDTALAAIGSIVNAGQSERTFLPTGEGELGRWRITALPHGNVVGGISDVALLQLRFSVEAQNVSLDAQGFSLASLSDPQTTVPCTADGVTGSITVTCDTPSSSAIERRIPGGSAITLLLRGNVTASPIVAGSASLIIRVRPVGDRTQTNAIRWTEGTTTFEWIDLDSTSIGGTLYRA